MGTDDNGYELAVLSPSRQSGKTPYRHPFFNRFTPSVGDTYASILGIPMRIPMLDIVPGRLATFRQGPAGSSSSPFMTSSDSPCGGSTEIQELCGGLVQCSCAASVHVEPSGSNVSQVSASLPASIR
jgi:hypothetical protein